MEANVLFRAINKGVLGAEGAMLAPDAVAQLIEQAQRQLERIASGDEALVAEVFSAEPVTLNP